MRLVNIDHLLDDFPSVAAAQQYYRKWIDDNISANRSEHVHVSPYDLAYPRNTAANARSLLHFRTGRHSR
jgi:hypothetical protein